MTPCLLCDSPVVPFARNRTTHFVRCPVCGLVRKELFPDTSAEHQRYKLHNNTLDDPGYRRYFSAMFEVIRPVLQQAGSTFLDYGSGEGRPVETMVGETLPGTKAYSWDPMLDDITPEKILQDIGRSAFDAITLIEVAEHFHHPKDDFERVFTLLGDGPLILRTMLYPSRVEDFARWWYQEDITHVHFYSEDTLEYICQTQHRSWQTTDQKHVYILEIPKKD